MKATGRFENTDELELTLEITMPLAQWERLREQLMGGTLDEPSLERAGQPDPQPAQCR